MSDQKARVDIKIYGEQYTVTGTSKPDHIEMMAEYVDQKMKKLVDINPKLTTAKAAVLAALNIADELSKLRSDYDNLLEIVNTIDECADNEK